ncbi:sensor histidine kinase [Microbacterium aquilitoris]|uniref:histidine kinase n=1 Tax=Microbacterium aquilitoris TaxID=3067307 RepID=A0ABU3GHN4_9MICO|nr:MULTISPECIES: ATP-binding protein [unclassified Microbacterium]MDT3330202.1 ATP-binding protein [Microbacterium sp. KSW-18]MDT3346035.1 ATP-binding protein [Microbacterium sp. KSW2-22]
MASPRRPRALRLVLLVLPSVVTLAALSATLAVAMTVQERTIRDATAERVMGVAQSLADLADVRTTLATVTDAGTPADLADAGDLAAATTALQPIAELVGESAGVYYVVITDDEGVRITHPLASERGVQVETTNSSVLRGETFLGTERGASGPSLRAKVPVRASDGTVVGMVAVGVLESSIAADRDAALAALLPWGIGALIVASLASSALTAMVERRFRRADAVAAENAQMRRTTVALREQAHEFDTRLHVIHGLVSRGDAAEALGYIEEVTPVRTSGSPDGGEPVAAATMHAVRAELLDLGAQAEFDVTLDRDLDDGAVSVVTNLCRNAGEAGARRVRCVLRDADGRLFGAVEDDGPGIDPNAAARIFAQGFTTKDDASGFGRGYGLDTVRRTVSSRGGTIEVGASALGGARFAFEMERV